jgi:hypothetical protein
VSKLFLVPLQCFSINFNCRSSFKVAIFKDKYIVLSLKAGCSIIGETVQKSILNSKGKTFTEHDETPYILCAAILDNICNSDHFGVKKVGDSSFVECKEMHWKHPNSEGDGKLYVARTEEGVGGFLVSLTFFETVMGSAPKVNIFLTAFCSLLL